MVAWLVVTLADPMAPRWVAHSVDLLVAQLAVRLELTWVVPRAGK